ncbi:MAG: 50S ribosomal protein L25 [Candidatus Pacebacteria bacterium]|jgi:large subunit ribosomal protein L25|nr:50S ribosomal protein L25 [Candidatus Paceibacterota bacterium]
MTITLKGEIRDPKTKLSAIRAEGFIPAVFYGHNQEATPCVFAANEFVKAWKAAGESTVVVLEMPKGKVNALITEVQVDPVKGMPIHADFYVIEKGHEVTVKVPVEFTGVSEAVKTLGGQLVKVMHDLEVKAQPENLPHSFTVDIAPLVALDSQILAESIVLPKGVTLVTHGNEVVAAIAVAKEEVETPVMDLSAIEVEKKGKKEEEATEEAK